MTLICTKMRSTLIKVSIIEYHHGPYGEGSVRHRRMYTYPNLLNHKINFFHLRHILGIKKQNISPIKKLFSCTDLILREDKFDHSFHYLVFACNAESALPLDKLPIRRDIFSSCKQRIPKNRVASMPHLEP